MTCARYLLERLQGEGVKYVFGIPGGQFRQHLESVEAEMSFKLSRDMEGSYRVLGEGSWAIWAKGTYPVLWLVVTSAGHVLVPSVLGSISPCDEPEGQQCHLRS